VDNKEKFSILKEGETVYPDHPDKAKLEFFDNPSPGNDYSIEFETSEFTSLCPITSQPDFGNIIISYIPDKSCIESKSLKLYLFSYRNYGGFAEKIVNRILDDVVKTCCPRQASVTGDFTARGGITIKVNAEYKGEGNK
jgi:7-cyano-7-deazaguanine reductase